jgi:hypothetical protein
MPSAHIQRWGVFAPSIGGGLGKEGADDRATDVKFGRQLLVIDLESVACLFAECSLDDVPGE